MRIGIGYDVHRLVVGRKLVIGGVTIPHEQGLEGHSDADVLLHALCDALLGAAGLGDMGKHFPDTDPQFKNMSSLKFLERVGSLLAEKKFKPYNIDAVVIAEEPKISPHREAMQNAIAKILKMDPTFVNIKATTEEGLGFTGTKQGIAAWAVVTLS